MTKNRTFLNGYKNVIKPNFKCNNIANTLVC